MLTLPMDYLLSEIHYEPSTGILTWKRTSKNQMRVAGTECGRADKNGYRFLNIGNKGFMGHRIAWAIYYGEWPPFQIDHINGVRDDNRIENLRLATVSQNIANTRVKASSGLKGVTKTRNGTWQAQIKVNGVNRYLGTHKDKSVAAEIYAKAALEAFGEFGFLSRPAPHE